MTSLNLSTLAIAAFSITLLSLPLQSAHAGGEGFSQSVLGGKETIDTKTYDDVGLGKFKANPWHISVSVRGGYDDNVNLSSFDERESPFLNGAIGLTYNFGSPRTKISLNTGISLTYYFDDNGDNGDDDFDDIDFDDDGDDIAINAWLQASVVHRATPRLTLSAIVNAAYLSQPGFDTFDANLFAVNRRDQNYFYTTNKFAAGYMWTPRFSTLTSYTLGYVNYDDEVLSDFEDRFEHTIGNEFRFLLTPTTTVVAEYRFGCIDYLEMDGRNSHSHFFLGGVDHSFSPRFNVSGRAGVEFREFEDEDDVILNGDIDDSRTAPYFETTLNYAVAKSTTITWLNRYALEQPNVPDALSRQTFRTSLSVRHGFTARISGALNFGFQHDDYDETFAIAAFNEDTFDLGVMLRYAMNRNFAFDIGYQRTQVVSDEALFREYSRNQYWAGLTWLW